MQKGLKLLARDADGIIRPAVDDGGRAVGIILRVACHVRAFYEAADLLYLRFQRGDRLVKLGRLDGDGRGVDDLGGVVGNGIVRLRRFGGAAARFRRGDGVVGEFLLRLGGRLHGRLSGGSLLRGIVIAVGHGRGIRWRHFGACRAASKHGQKQQCGEKDGKNRSFFHDWYPFLLCSACVTADPIDRGYQRSFCRYLLSIESSVLKRRIFWPLVAQDGKFFLKNRKFRDTLAGADGKFIRGARFARLAQVFEICPALEPARERQLCASRVFGGGQRRAAP